MAFLYVVQAKTEKHELSARLKILVSGALKQAIEDSRLVKPVRSPFIVHRLPKRVTAAQKALELGQITPEMLSKSFAKVRDQLPEFENMSANERPTFHEIRGLGGAEYLKQGYSKEYVQRLMGHASEKMTSEYTDRHESWTECAAELSLKSLDIGK